MPRYTDRELFAKLKEGTLAPVYFLYGAESYFIRAAVQKIEEKAAGGMEGFNLRKFQGDKASVGEIEDACETLPMMAEKKCVSVCDMDAEKLNKPEYDRLLAVISNPVETTVFVLFLLNVPVDLKRSAKWRKLAELAEKTGVVCEFAQKDKTTLKRALCERAKKEFLSMDMQTAGLLVDWCSQDYAVLLNEMDKLISHAQNGEITEKDVRECCIRSLDASAFDLAKSILSGKYDRAFSLLDELFSLRQEAVSILGALNLVFSDMYRAKCAQTSGKTPDDVAADFHYPKTRLFAVRNAFRDVQGVSAQHIRRCISALYDADRALKSSRAGDRLVMEQMLGRMLASSVREGRA